MTTFYRALLRLYPASFRLEYAGELTLTFGDLTRGQGRGAAAMAAVKDVVPNAIALHAELLWQDLVSTSRSLRRAPGFALTAMLAVALAVGASTAVFTLADFVFVKPLPYPEPDRLVRLYETDASGPYYGDISPANFRDWKQQQRSFSAMGAFAFRPANLVSVSDPRRIEIVRTTPEVLPLLGVRPVVGRLFSAEDTLSGQSVVISHALWQSQFGGDAGVVGTTVRLDGTPHTVAGVMPPSFQFPNQGVDAWAPLVFGEDDFADRSNRYTFGIARLRRGVSRQEAQSDLDRIATGLERLYPADNHRTGAMVAGLRGKIPQRASLLVIALCGAAVCILLLAFANLASLSLARRSPRLSRTTAPGLRATAGVGRRQLSPRPVVERLLLALAGGALGIVAATVSVPWLARLVPTCLPVSPALALDSRALTFAVGLILLSGLAFGVGSAMRGRSGRIGALRGGVRAIVTRAERVRATLVVVEVAACVVLLIVSGLLVRSAWRIQSLDPGFSSEHVLTLRTALPLPKYDPTAKRVAFYERVLQEVRALPGVQSAAYTSGLPLVMRGGIRSATLPGADSARSGSEAVMFRYASSQYFSSLGIPFRSGRDFADSDTRAAPPVAIVSESFARRHWPGEELTGKRFIVAGVERTIVGVVGDVRVRGLEGESEPQVYLPPAQVKDGSHLGYTPKELVVRAPGSVAELIPRIREIVIAADPEQPVSHVRLLTDILADETAPRMTQVRILIALSAIALLIAGLGVHGLFTPGVSRRAREMSGRGAPEVRAGGVVGRVLREGLLPTAAGIGIGVAVAYGAASGMRALLFGVQPDDPLTIAIAVALCFTTAVAGCVRPAVRAARADPMLALRTGRSAL